MALKKSVEFLWSDRFDRASEELIDACETPDDDRLLSDVVQLIENLPGLFESENRKGNFGHLEIFFKRSMHDDVAMESWAFANLINEPPSAPVFVKNLTELGKGDDQSRVLMFTNPAGGFAVALAVYFHPTLQCKLFSVARNNPGDIGRIVDVLRADDFDWAGFCPEYAGRD